MESVLISSDNKMKYSYLSTVRCEAYQGGIYANEETRDYYAAG